MSMPNPLPRHSSLKAFTIIELLVAVGVTALMVSLMLTIVVNVLSGWSKSSGTLSSGNQARTLMDLVSQDLQSAIMRRDGNVWMVATVQDTATGGDWASGLKPTGTASSSMAPTGSRYIPALPSPITSSPADLDSYRFGQGGVWLRFFSTVSDVNTSVATISAPRAISYKIVRQSVASGSNEKRYMFYRSELPSNTTFATGYNLFDAAYYTGAASVIKTPATTALVANNVVDFGVRFFKLNSASQLIPIFPDSSDVCFAVTSDTTKVGGGVESTPKQDFPVAAEIFVRILTDEGANKIANLENGISTTETWWDIVLANSRVYTRRVEIKSTGL